MNKRDLTIGAVIVSLFGVWAIVGTRSVPANTPEPVQMQVPVAIALGPNPLFRGDTKSPVTLIEFGDYECPPCARMHLQVQEFLSLHRGQVRFVFRHFPLSFHPQSRPAALLAEEARARGQFWAAHDALYGFEGNLDESRLQDLKRELHLSTPASSTQAKQRLQRDKSDAERLHIQGTPSFFAVMPRGQVWQLQSPAQLAALLSK